MKFFMLLIIASAFLGANLLSFNIGLFQMSPYRILIIITPILILINLKTNKTITELKKSENYYSYFFMLIWLIYSLATIIFVKDVYSWFKTLTFVYSGVLSIWCIGLYFNSKEDFYKTFRLIEIFVIVHSLIGFYEIVTGDYKFIQYINQLYYNSKLGSAGMRVPMGIFGNPNDYALFCLMGFYLAFICYKIKTNKIGRLISLTLMISCAFLIFATDSRANFIGLLISLVPFWILFFKRASIFKKVSLFYVTMIAVLIIGHSFPKMYQDAIPKLITIDVVGQGVDSDIIRINLLKNGLLFLKDSFFIGTGVGNIEYNMAYNSVYYVGKVTNIHNWWFEILVSSGVVIFTGYIVMYIRNMWLLKKIIKYSEDIQNIFIAKVFYSFMFAFIIGSMSSSSNINKDWLWMFFGVIFAFINFSLNDLNTKN